MSFLLVYSGELRADVGRFAELDAYVQGCPHAVPT